MELIDKDDLIRYMTATSGFSTPADLARHVAINRLSEGWLGGYLSAISAAADYQPPACIPLLFIVLTAASLGGGILRKKTG